MSSSETKDSFSDDDLKELSGYFKNIKKYEGKQIRSQKSLIMYVWGYLLIMAGVSDLYFSMTVNFGPNFFAWASAVIVAFLTQNQIAKLPILFEEFEEDYSPFPKFENNTISIIGTVVMFAVTVVFGSLFLQQYIMPFISFTIAILNLVEEKIDPRTTTTQQFFSYLITGVILSIIVAIDINTSGFDWYLVNGFIFGLINGGVLVLEAKREKNLVIQ
ncbi:MAG: hypothetical protein INQ03_17880 [Candidatus Heimdallarchaeota archaeon]|nr:hypothetical protein [Candidatus Heimdallarchaeota archaeon]